MNTVFIVSSAVACGCFVFTILDAIMRRR